MNYVCGNFDGERQTENLIAMIWTTEPPTQEGWYWARTNKGQPFIIRVGFYGTGQTGTLWAYDTERNMLDLDVLDYWLGPLPVPEPPKESE